MLTSPETWEGRGLPALSPSPQCRPAHSGFRPRPNPKWSLTSETIPFGDNSSILAVKELQVMTEQETKCSYYDSYQSSGVIHAGTARWTYVRLLVSVVLVVRADGWWADHPDTYVNRFQRLISSSFSCPIRVGDPSPRQRDSWLLFVLLGGLCSW